MTFAAPRADLGTLNADLHCHSTASDGTLAPERVAQRAADKRRIDRTHASKELFR